MKARTIVNIIISFTIFFLWCIANEYFHVAYDNLLTIYRYTRLEYVQETGQYPLMSYDIEFGNMIFQIAVYSFGFIVVTGCIWIVFGNLIMDLIKKKRESEK